MTQESQTVAPVVSIEDLKKVAGQSLGDNRLENVGPDTLLLRDGIVSSIEWVSLLVDLERHFKKPLADAADPSSMTLGFLLAALGGEKPKPAAASPTQKSRVYQSLRRGVQKPLVLGGTFLFAFAACNALLVYLVREPLHQKYLHFLEDGKRLYPFGGKFSQDDFGFAMKFHRVQKPLETGERRVLVFGDSGTVGSFVTAEESIPGQIEDGFAASEHVRVMNLAWYGRHLAKDLMLLEAAWDTPFHDAVFTLSQIYFNSYFNNAHAKVLDHISFNTPLFRSFVRRVPAREAAPFQDMLSTLEDAEQKNRDGWYRAALTAFGSLHYSPFVLYGWQSLQPEFINNEWRIVTRQMKEERALVGNRIEVNAGVPEDALDTRMVEILKVVLRMLHERHVSVVLYLEPEGPNEWEKDRSSQVPVSEIVAPLCGGDLCRIADATWMAHASDFLDTSAHYTVETNQKIGRCIATVLQDRSGKECRAD